MENEQASLMVDRQQANRERVRQQSQVRKNQGQRYQDMGDSVEVEKYTALSLGLRVRVVWEEQPSWVNQTDHVPNKQPSKHQKGIRTRNQGSKKQEWVLNRTKTEAKNTGSISIEQEIGNELGPGMQHPGQGIQAMSHSKPWKNENHRNQETCTE